MCRYMGVDEQDLEGAFVVLKDAKKTVEWYVDNAENADFDEDPDYDVRDELQRHMCACVCGQLAVSLMQTLERSLRGPKNPSSARASLPADPRS